MPQRNVPRSAAVYGIDIGTNIFHVVGLGSDGVPVQKVRFRRDTLLQFFERAAAQLCDVAQFLMRHPLGGLGDFRRLRVRGDIGPEDKGALLVAPLRYSPRPPAYP